MSLQGSKEERAVIIVPAGLLEKIDRNRDQMTRAEFVEFCVDTLLGEEKGRPSPAEGGSGPCQTEETVSREEFEEFKRKMKDTQRRYIDFFVSVVMEPFSKASAEEQERFRQQIAELLQG